MDNWYLVMEIHKLYCQDVSPVEIAEILDIPVEDVIAQILEPRNKRLTMGLTDTRTRQMLLALFNTGESDETIAEDLGASVTAVATWRNSLGFPDVDAGDEKVVDLVTQDPKEVETRKELRERIRTERPRTQTWLDKNPQMLDVIPDEPSRQRSRPKKNWYSGNSRKR